MSDLVPIYVQQATRTKLQQLALLAGGVNEVIERLIDHWQNAEHLANAPQPDVPLPVPAMWTSPNGDELPIGQQLVAIYKGKTFHADVEAAGLRFNGELYRNPTAAGRAVKQSMGLSGTAASTDGRTFWKLLDPTSGRYITVGELNPGKAIDVTKILSELKALGAKSAA